ncbi:flavin reductase family protein [candidate division KSB1 bacterium]|nr:flavin reductase family protein [candidate division KSB1 bacterium]
MKKSIGAKTYLCPTPVLVIGTFNTERKANLMTVAWGGICCTKPPCVAISLRKATYTYENITDRKAFTVNIPSEEYTREIDYIGLVSGRDTDKFEDCNFTAVASDIVDAPYIAEFPMILECKLLHTLEIGLHTQFIGEIMDIKADESVLDEKERIATELLKPISFSPSDRNYFKIGEKIGRAFIIGKEIKQ